MTPQLWAIVEAELARPSDISLRDLFGEKSKEQIAAMLGTPGYWEHELRRRGHDELVIAASLSELPVYDNSPGLTPEQRWPVKS